MDRKMECDDKKFAVQWKEGHCDVNVGVFMVIVLMVFKSF